MKIKEKEEEKKYYLDICKHPNNYGNTIKNKFHEDIFNITGEKVDFTFYDPNRENGTLSEKYKTKLKNKDKVIYLIKNGLVGEILVNGKKFNQPMPANNQLTNLDIAEVVTYIYNEWNGETKITEVKEVEKVLNRK